MSKLTIPDELIIGFKNIEELSETAFDKIIELVKGLSDDFSSKNFANAINATIGNSDSRIAEVLLSLVPLVTDNSSKADIAEELVNSYRNKREGESFNDKILLERLQVIFENNDQVVVMYKINKLIAENANTYRESDIITDLRLVFNEPPNIPKENQRRTAIIIHRLKMGYFKSGNYKEVFFSLDRNDLVSLKSVIERALLKEDCIKSDYSSSIDIYNI